MIHHAVRTLGSRTHTVLESDEYGRANDLRIYAAGHRAEKRHSLTGTPVHWPSALAVNRAGRAVGRTVSGSPTPAGGVVGTRTMQVLDLQVARTGIVDAEVAREAGFDPVRPITTITPPTTTRTGRA